MTDTLMTIEQAARYLSLSRSKRCQYEWAEAVMDAPPPACGASGGRG